MALSEQEIRRYLRVILADYARLGGGGAICLEDGSYPALPDEALIELKQLGYVKAKFALAHRITTLHLTPKGRGFLRRTEGK